MNYHQAAELLDRAASTAQPVAQLNHRRSFNLEEAYAIQSISIGRRLARGEQLTGMKLGFTSKAKMEQMGVHDMIWGQLTDAMTYQPGADLRKSQFIHPRAEPEIAFRLAKAIDQPLQLETAARYVDGLAVALEIIDSRYENFKFSLEDVVADNCSSTAYVLGDWQPVNSPIRDISIELCIDEAIVHAGNSDAILGNPWESLVNATRLALDHGVVLAAGQIILAGAATAAVYLEAGQKVSAVAEGLGEVTINVVP
ncbi:MAG: fumarylacetoacetate hydrolase family protein [Bacteroidota bacterium]